MKVIFMLITIFFNISCYAQWTGGDADGSDFGIMFSASSLYSGGIADGSAFRARFNSASIYRGGEFDGHTTSTYDNVRTIYSGGTDDGYNIAEEYFSYRWSGMVNSDWTLSSNWKNFTVPTYLDNVSIPSCVPNFPILTSGSLVIGQFSASSSYSSNGLNIHIGAQITLLPSASLLNYGVINIFGSLYCENVGIDAIINKGSGFLTIHPNGSLIID